MSTASMVVLALVSLGGLAGLAVKAEEINQSRISSGRCECCGGIIETEHRRRECVRGEHIMCPHCWGETRVTVVN